MDWQNDPANLRIRDVKRLRSRRKAKRKKKPKRRAIVAARALERRERERKLAEDARAPSEAMRLDWHAGRARGLITRATLERLYTRQDGSCHYCGRRFALHTVRLGPAAWNAYFQIEHKNPVCRGGTNFEWNLVLACQPCNRAKFTMTEAEFLKSEKRPEYQRDIHWTPKPTSRAIQKFVQKVVLRKKGSEQASTTQIDAEVAQQPNASTPKDSPS